MPPPPKDAAAFDRAYREEHLPYAGPRLAGATGVTTKRVLGAPGGNPSAYAISFVAFPNAAAAKTCAQSKGGQEALQLAASISTGGPPQFLLVEDKLRNACWMQSSASSARTPSRRTTFAKRPR